MKKRIEELEKLLHESNCELENLHVGEPSEIWYKIRREELEYRIACLENDLVRYSRSRAKVNRVLNILSMAVLGVILFGMLYLIVYL